MVFARSERLNRLPKQFFADLTARAARLVHQGHDVINLGQGNPDLPTPAFIVEALKEAADDPITHRYPPFRGLSSLREAIASFYWRHYQVQVDPEREVAILFGGKAGLGEISLALLNAGDAALVPDPGYPDYLSGIALAGARAVPYLLLEKNCFLPDYEMIGKEDWRQAKLLFLNYPNNPTGAMATAEVFEETVAMAVRHQVAVVHDFAYGAIGFVGKPRSFLQTEGGKEVGVEIYTLSKTFNMAGWRVAFAVGNERMIEALELLQDHLYVSLFGAVQKAATAALAGGDEAAVGLAKTYLQRRDSFLRVLREGGYPDLIVADGTFYVWLPTPTRRGSKDFADRLLNEAHVVVAPGVGFGEGGEGYVRVALLAAPERLEEGAKRILSVL